MAPEPNTDHAGRPQHQGDAAMEQQATPRKLDSTVFPEQGHYTLVLQGSSHYYNLLVHDVREGFVQVSLDPDWGDVPQANLLTDLINFGGPVWISLSQVLAVVC